MALSVSALPPRPLSPAPPAQWLLGSEEPGTVGIETKVTGKEKLDLNIAVEEPQAWLVLAGNSLLHQLYFSAQQCLEIAFTFLRAFIPSESLPRSKAYLTI